MHKVPSFVFNYLKYLDTIGAASPDKSDLGAHLKFTNTEKLMSCAYMFTCARALSAAAVDCARCVS